MVLSCSIVVIPLQALVSLRGGRLARPLLLAGGLRPSAAASTAMGPWERRSGGDLAREQRLSSESHVTLNQRQLSDQVFTPGGTWRPGATWKPRGHLGSEGGPPLLTHRSTLSLMDISHLQSRTQDSHHKSVEP